MSAALLDAYAAAWATGRAAAIAAFWAPQDFRFYKAEEVAEPFTAWADTEAYWRANEAMHEIVRLGFSHVTPMSITADFGVILARMRWDIRFAAAAPPALAGRAMGGDNHVLAMTRGASLIGWCEAPDAPIAYLRRLYEESARL